MPFHAVHSSETLTASARHEGRTAVLTLTGAVDRAAPVPSGASVEAALRTVESMLSSHPRAVVADLAHVELTHFTIGLLSLLRRRTARVGIPLVLAGVSPEGQDLLDRARISPLYPTYPTVPVALGALSVTTLASRRTRAARRARASSRPQTSQYA
jgi:hypothetical protein